MLIVQLLLPCKKTDSVHDRYLFFSFFAKKKVPSIAPIPATNVVSTAVGKLNLNDFQKVSAALQQSKRPLPASEDIDQHGYAVPKDTMGNPIEKSEYAAPVDLQEPKPASRSKPRHRERREQRASHQGNFKR